MWIDKTCVKYRVTRWYVCAYTFKTRQQLIVIVEFVYL